MRRSGLGLRSRAISVGGVAVLAAATLVAGATAAGATRYLQEGSQATPLYEDQHAAISSRVKDLLHRMTLAEKVGQMTQPALVNMQGQCQWNGGQLNQACMKHVLVDLKAGSILSGGGETPPQNTPQAWATMVDKIQHYAIENSRLHIPVIYGVDAVHGHNNVLGATIFPQQIGLGATWDTDLMGKVGGSTAKAVKATGINWDFAPVMGVSRDTRWGRYYETYSEDPDLAGSMGSSFIRGLQASGKVAATDKHFAGYSEPLTGHDRVPAHLDMRYLRDTFLPPYKAAVDAGALTLMANSGAVNGVPVHASHYLLTDVLRNQWHFKGVVVSDWDDVAALWNRYHVASDYPQAIAMAVNAGVDMGMLPPGSVDGFVSGLLADVHSGAVSRHRIDQAVSRILWVKFKLGLFDNPYVDPSKANKAVLGADSDLATKAATESMVLLRNANLPLSTGIGKVVVAGRSADSVANQDGGWTIGWQGIPAGVNEPGVTVYQGIKKVLGAGKVSLATNADQAVSETQSADAAIVVVGETPGAEGGNDKEVPALSSDQQNLIDRLQATGKPVIVVLVASRPLVLGSAADAKNLLMAWLPGSQAGTAVANVLFGKADPSGRLPVSWPKTTGDVPMFYQQAPGTNAGTSSNYDPLFPFGAGLSYTTFSVNGLQVHRHGRSVEVSVTVSNTGDRDGAMVNPVYVTDPVGPTLTAPKQLATFDRVTLKAGQSRTVRLTVPLSRLAVTTGDITGTGKRQVRHGSYTFSAGNRTATLRL